MLAMHFEMRRSQLAQHVAARPALQYSWQPGWPPACQADQLMSRLASFAPALRYNTHNMNKHFDKHTM
jgi:hypothetical protein